MKYINSISKRMISMAFCVLFAFSMFTAFAVSEDASANSENPCSEALLAEMAKSGKDDLISVYVWFENIDYNEVEKTAQQRTGLTEELLDAEEKKIEPINLDIFSMPEEKAEAETKKYIQHSKEQRTRTHELVDQYIMAKREAARELYTQANQKNLDSLKLEEKSIQWVSQYSPVVIANVTVEQIKKLAGRKAVNTIDLRNNETPTPSMTNAMAAVEDTYVRDTLGFDGHKVKVGIYDSGVVGTHTELNSTNLTRLDDGEPISSHATTVARVLAGSKGPARNATVYSISPYLLATNEARLEALITKGAVVINLSLGFSRSPSEPNQLYVGFERWIDHIGYDHNVSMVIAAGNDGTDATVTCPGLSYNVLTVGAMYHKETATMSDDIFCDFTSTANGASNGCAKPDFSAPGQSVLGTSGTSFAAPIVAGVIAQMMEYKPTLKDNPALVKAVLTASCVRKTAGESLAGLTAKEGAGVINARKAIWILGAGRFTTGNIASSTKNHTFTVTSSDNKISVGLAWLRSVSINAPSNQSAHNVYPSAASLPAHANLNLEILKPNGSSAGTSTFANSSAEKVYFNVSTTGTYKAKITRASGSGSNSVKYALAWY